MRVAVPERLLSMPGLAVLVLNRSRQILMGCRLVNEERAEGLGLDWFRCSMSVKYANCCACPPTPSKGAARTRVESVALRRTRVRFAYPGYAVRPLRSVRAEARSDPLLR